MPKPSTPAIWASGKSFSFSPSPAQQAQGFDYIASVRPGTGAPITDDHDWPLNQITRALAWVLDSGFGYGSSMIGVPIPWPLAVMPQDIWPDLGMVFLASAGQSFSATTYPKLALAYPSLVLPDMRSEFIRGWDAGRGIDTGRTILSQQSSANLAHVHVEKFAFARYNSNPGGVNSSSSAFAKTYWDPVSDSPTGTLKQSAGGIWSGPSSGLDTTSSGDAESRPRNIAFNYIVRAA